MGEGHCIHFLYDPWSGPIPLKDLYLDLFACAVSKEAWIYDLIVSNLEGGNRSWNLQFRQAFHEREVERACSLLKHLYSNMPRGERDDMLTWKLNHFGVFDVCSYYNLLADSDGSSSNPFPWKCIWSTKVPKRVSFFLWIAARGSIFLF